MQIAGSLGRGPRSGELLSVNRNTHFAGLSICAIRALLHRVALSTISALSKRFAYLRRTHRPDFTKGSHVGVKVLILYDRQKAAAEIAQQDGVIARMQAVEALG